MHAEREGFPNAVLSLFRKLKIVKYVDKSTVISQTSETELVYIYILFFVPSGMRAGMQLK